MRDSKSFYQKCYNLSGVPQGAPDFFKRGEELKMEIKASVTFDREVCKAFTDVHFYKKQNPKKIKALKFISAVVTTAIAVAAMICLDVENPTFFVICSSACWVIVAMDFVVLKRGQKTLSYLNGTRQEYVFTDDEITATMSGAELSGTSRLKYSAVFKVMETSKYFFIYQASNSAYIIDKSTLSGGTAEELRAKFSPLGQKYIVCKY